MLDPLALARALANLGGAIVIGAGFLLWFTRDVLTKSGGAHWCRRVADLIFAAAAISLVANFYFTMATASEAAGGSAFAFNLGALQIFLTKTWAGGVSCIELGFGLLALVLAGLAWLSLEKAETSDRFFLLSGAVASIGLSAVALASHPTSVDPAAVGIFGAIAHRLAFSLWLGGLPALILLIGVGSIAEDTKFLSGTVLRRFSKIATLAMMVILASGIVLTWYLVRNFASAIGTAYGHLLIIKLMLLGGVLYIARGLQQKLLPLVEMKPSASVILSYAKRVKLESLLALLIVIVASNMAQQNPPEHEDIYWPLPFRFSLYATWSVPWVPTRFLGGAALVAAGLGLIAVWGRPSLWPGRTLPIPGRKSLLYGGAGSLIAGAALALPAISVQAYPDTFLTTEIPYSTQSVAAGLRHFEENCTPCHGVSGLGNGPLAKSMKVQPADFSAPHTSLHTAGDLYWWVTHGIEPSGMPAFGDALTNDDRWDIINWLGAFSVGYQARIISPAVVPGQAWLIPPDFLVTDEQGRSTLMSEYRLKSALLLVLCAGPQDVPRVEQLVAARQRFDQLGLQVVVIAPGGAAGQSQRELAARKVLVVNNDPDAALAAYGLYTRTFADAKVDAARVPVEHAEFLIDISGYIRARWIPSQSDDADSWSDLSVIERQMEVLNREPPKPPPPDIHSTH